jgi:hypothetical protein
MAYSPNHHSAAPYYGARSTHGAHTDRRRPRRPSASGPDIPHYYADSIPWPFLDFSFPVTAPRDMPPITGRVSRPRPYTARHQEMRDFTLFPEGSRTRHVTSCRRQSSQVWHVPDPPTWAAPPNEHMPARGPAISQSSGMLPQRSPSNDPPRGSKVHRPQSPLTPPPEPRTRSDAAFTHGLPSPPPTPRIPRLRTPDLEPLDECKLFCSCCPETERDVDSRYMMELQCKLRCRVLPRFSLAQMSVG